MAAATTIVALAGGELEPVEALGELGGARVEAAGGQRDEVGAARRPGVRRLRALDQVGVDAEAGQQPRAEPQPLQTAHRRRLGLAQQQPQLRAQPRAGDGGERAVGDRRERPQARLLLDLEAQPRAVAHEPQQPRRVVEERALVQHAQPPRREVLERARHRLERAVGEPHGERVDAEVAPRQVLAQRDAELDLRQRTRALRSARGGWRRC